MNHNKLELADIFRDHGHQLGLLSRNNSKVVNAILDCRTPALGGHLYQCDGCGIQDQSYNSCRNRHCPKCQFTAKREWIEERIKDVLEVPYHHVVFTIPHEINELVITNKALLYSILFKASAKTLKAVFRKKYKSNPGIISVLHTWSQAVCYQQVLSRSIASRSKPKKRSGHNWKMLVLWSMQAIHRAIEIGT